MIAIRGMLSRLISGSSVITSLVLPLFDRAMTQSSRVTIPISPCDASAGWTKKAGEPVLASVAATLPAMWPLFPMPVTTTRPVVDMMCRQASAKDWSNAELSAEIAAPSSAMVRCADSIKKVSACWIIKHVYC